MRELLEEHVFDAVQWLRLLIEAIGAIIVAVGLVVAVWAILSALLRGRAPGFVAVRISFARYLALALEFQLGADILSTAIAPTWDQIGKLGAIAVIRTALNFFLMREMETEQEELKREKRASDGAPAPP